jgi:hypothetical protein
MSYIPLDFKPFGVKIEFNNMECSSDKREPFVGIPIEKKDIFLYLCENQNDFNPTNILNYYFEIKKNTFAFHSPMIYYYHFYIAIQNDEIITSWREINLHFFEYFLGIRYSCGDHDFVLKPHYFYF